MIITAITPQKHDASRCNIEVDGRFFCGMQLLTVMEHRLKAGSVVTEEELSALIGPAKARKVRGYFEGAK